jgi:hypothetical protein
VRKDNIISWKGNFYTLPSGTYKGRGTQVSVSPAGGLLNICSLTGTPVCSPAISTEKGKTIINTDHRRDKSGKIQRMISDLSLLFDNPVLSTQFMANIHKEKPRYIRDQLILLKQTLSVFSKTLINKTLKYCIEMHVYSANDFKSVAESFLKEQSQIEAYKLKPILTNPLSGAITDVATHQPMRSSIYDYEHLMQGGN